ncbi:hypothetical protein PGIGA_G00241790 [Pangasianodon gigas]|uniref:Uncharacterized protein n=1 Tax=Pangasianodon gigas TaxID=30993 RepID=A0ACC5WNN3_PANGG|nr:hypothetical protein [Pangasianodon gigas]
MLQARVEVLQDDDFLCGKGEKQLNLSPALLMREREHRQQNARSLSTVSLASVQHLHICNPRSVVLVMFLQN